MYKVIVHKRAAKYLSKLPKSQKDKIKVKLKSMETDPLQISEVKSMQGEWKGYYRMRIGDIRIIFWIDQKEHTIYVDHIGHRGDIY